MHIRVQGGTARHDEPSLCLTCRSAMIAQGQSARDEVIRCSRFDSRISFRVTTCTEYVHRRHPSLWHMEDVAWILRAGTRGGQIGFVRARDLGHADRHVLSDDE
jgi:hypothetical protein